MMNNPVREYMAQIGAKGGATRARRLTEAELSEIGRKHVNVRWARRAQLRTIGEVAQEMIGLIQKDGLSRTLFKDRGTHWFALATAKEARRAAKAHPSHVIGTYGVGAAAIDIVGDAGE